MRRIRLLALNGLTLAMLACRPAPGPAPEQQEQSPSPEPSLTPAPAPSATPLPMPEPDQAQPAASATPFELPIPVGQRAYNIRIPDYNEIGNLMSLVSVAEIKHTEENQAVVRGVEIELLDDEGNTEFLIDLPESELDLKNRVLTSDQPARIRNERIEIIGETFKFGAEDRSVLLEGQVYMGIKNIGGLLKEEEP